jgi:hypothetical protein
MPRSGLVQRTDAPNYHAFGTFATHPAFAGCAPKASGSERQYYYTKNNANRPMQKIAIPSELLSCLLLFPLRGQEPRQKQVGIGHWGR